MNTLDCWSSFINTTLEQTERSELIEILGMLTKALELQSINYMLSDGSLIGSYRHHGFIPWDLDVDIEISMNDKARTIGLISSLNGFKYSQIWSQQFHVHKLNSFYPNVDIWFYKENATHGFSPDGHIWLQQLVFPLIKRPFENLRLFVPFCTKAFIESEYPGFENICLQIEKWRGLNRPRATCRTNCSELFAKFPFVFREGIEILNENFTYHSDTFPLFPLNSSFEYGITQNFSTTLTTGNEIEIEILKFANKTIQTIEIKMN